MKLARAARPGDAAGQPFETSRKIPEEVFATGELKIVADLLDGDLANEHMGTVALGIRHVLCTPLRLVRYLDRADMQAETRAHRRALSRQPREGRAAVAAPPATALDTLATEAGVAIENARLYRETLEKARIEHELRIAAEIQRALLPQGRRDGHVLRGDGRVAAVAVDRRRLLRLHRHGRRRLRRSSLGDVAGKGPAAALLTAKIQGLFSAPGRRRQSAVGDDAGEQGLLKRADRRPLRHRLLRHADRRRAC